MKKILTRPKTTTTYVTHCQCGCEFTFQDEDVRNEMQNGELLQYTTCPNCDNILYKGIYEWRVYIKN